MPIAANQKLFLGIDPGNSGGMVVVSSTGALINLFQFKDRTRHEIADWLANIAPAISRAAMEKVGAMPGQGVCAMFTFGVSYGFLQGLLAAMKVPYVDVMPQKWQPRFSIPPRKGKKKTEHKKIIRQKAHQLWPAKMKELNLAVCDAALIAEYLRLQEAGQ